MKIPKHKHIPFTLSPLFLFIFFSLHLQQNLAVGAQNGTPTKVRVGVVLDLDTMAGKRSKTSISMAIEDFYAANPDFKTRVVPEYRDSKSDAVIAASAALDLLKNSEVHAIIGPQTSTETDFVANMCNQSHVPLLSFSASSPSISPSHLPFFVRAIIDDSAQSTPIASFIQYFKWQNVVLIYEDSEYGSGIIPSLVDALQLNGTNVSDRVAISTEASDDQIDEALYRIMTSQTRVFIVHMLPMLASRLFLRAQVLGMMSNGYVWVVTDSVGDVFDTLDPNVIRAMEGVIGFRPYVADSDKINIFSKRFKPRFRQENPSMAAVDPNVYQFWAYDAVWAMAMAVEMANVTNPTFTAPQSGTTDLSRIGISKTGPKLLHAILNTTFDGLTGKFRLVNNQLQLSAFEIVNVIGKSYRSIGFWTRDGGIIREIGSRKDNNTLRSTIIWPGDSIEVPKGWAESNQKALRILVPVKEGFNVFVNISGQTTAANNTTSGVTGYCIDVFNAVLSKLPYDVPYEFYPFVNTSDTYDNLVYQVYQKNYDMAVGDITIRYNRTQYVDFTLPYTDTGVSMVVPFQSDSRTSMWIFLKPLTRDLWVATVVFFFFTGLVVWIIEHGTNPAFRGTRWQQFGQVLYFAFSTLVFAHKEKLESNLSRLTVIIWVFVVLILTSSYSASLASMLTVQHLTPTVTDVNLLLERGDYVGYQDTTFVRDLLIDTIGFAADRVKNYTNADQYAEALSKGSANGGVSAIFDEIPYLKVFLAQYCDNYTMTGPTYKTDGFGIVLPRGSSLLRDMSRAVLSVTEGDEMTQIQNKWLINSDTTSCPSQSMNYGSSSLSFHSFAGLFIITGGVYFLVFMSYLAMFIYKEKDELISMVTPDRSKWEVLRLWVVHYDGIGRNSPTLREFIRSSMSWRRENQEGIGARQTGPRSPGSTSNRTSEMNFAFVEEGILTPPETDHSASPSNRDPSEEPSLELTVER